LILKSNIDLKERLRYLTENTEAVPTKEEVHFVKGGEYLLKAVEVP
jgi:hypothetical protein